jgi:outer membrane protein assembly factor BamB
MAQVKYEIILKFTAYLLISIISFGVIYEPTPKVTIFNRVIISDSINWKTYRVDASHIGIAPNDCTIDSSLQPEWRTKRLNRGEYSASKSSPAIDNNRIYIGLDTGKLVAIDRETGEIIWGFNTRFSRNGIHGSPTIDSNRNLVYIGAYDGWIYALKIETGELEWENKLGDYIGSSPTLYNNTVYVGVEMRAPDGYIVGVDADTGKEVFRSNKLGNHPHSTPTVDAETESIFIGENNGYLHCYWIKNQTEKWRFNTGGDIKSTSAVFDGVVYITSWSGRLFAINVRTGIAIWTHSAGYRSMSSPTVDSYRGIVYYGDHRGCFFAINASNGDTVWRYQTGNRILSSPTLVNGTNTVIIGSKDGFVYLLEADTGRLKQKIQLISGLTGVPVAVGNHLYVFDHLGYLYSFFEPNK